MMKLIKYFLLAVLLLEPLGSAWAQDSKPVTVTFAIRRPSNAWPPDFGLSGMFPSVSLWERTDSLNLLAYTTNRGAGMDSVFFPEDSVNQLTEETLYQITVKGRGYGTVTNTTDNGTRSDSTIDISMRKLTQRSDSSATYTVWRKRANRRVIDNLGFTFNSDVKNGEKYEIALTHDRPLEFKRDASDNLNTVTYSPVSRLTIKTGSDTFSYATGAVATDWFPANNANLSVATKLYSLGASTGGQIAVGYVLSWDSLEVILPLDDATSLNDTTFKIDDDITGRIGGRWNGFSFTHPICRWMKLIIFGKNASGRVVQDSIAVFTAN